jgi:hypothetical protein
MRSASSLWLLLTALPLAACTSGAYHARVDLEPGVVRAGPLPLDSIREIAPPAPGPRWQERLTDRIGGPYEVLASIDATSATVRALELGRRRMREETARLGGNAMVVLGATRDARGPYTSTRGQALRLLPPMPDAAARCLAPFAAPISPANTAAHVVACREFGRQQPTRADAPARQAAAHLALALSAAQGPAADGALSAASLAMTRAAALDARYRAAAPWLAVMQPILGADTLRAALLLARRLEMAGLASAAIDAAREGVRIAAANEAAVSLAADLLRRAGRLRESRAVAAEFARLEPDRVEGWLLAGMAASRAGDHVLAMKAFARVEAIDARYFTRLRMDSAKGADEEHASRRAAGRQRAATIEEIDADGA